MTDVLDSEPVREPAKYRRLRASRRVPWRRRQAPQTGLDELRALRPGEGEEDLRSRRWWQRRRRRRRPLWFRVLSWALLALAAWIGVSVVLFVISSLTAEGVPASAVAALDGGGLPPFSASTILVLGSDARPAGSKEPGADPGGPSRSDTMMLIRTGGGHSARLSIPRDMVVEIPGHGFGKINSAFAYGGAGLAVKTVENFLGIPINHVLIVNFTKFPQLVDAMGGVNYTGSCVVSYINGGFRDGGFTLRLPTGTHHLDGAQALALARTRENHCNARETDLTREIRQQKLLLDMKSQALSFSGFIRLPWIAWALPRAIQTDMNPLTLAGVLTSLELNGNAHNAILYPTGTVGVSGLTIDPSRKQADVAAFLRS
jgi:LCP family protein required for cell wall assembly